MSPAKIAVLLATVALPLAVSACADAPQYAVRPGEPRAQMPKPTYASSLPGDADRSAPGSGAPLPPSRSAPQAAYLPPPTSYRPTASSPYQPAQPSAPPSRASSEDAPAYYKPEPIPGAPPPPDEAGPSLRGHQSPGPAMPVRSAPPPALETPREVVVRPGESLFEVAERVRTPIRAIIDLNGLQPPYDVTPGSTLKIPAPVIYTVKAGDTFLSLSRRFSIDPRSLANLNDLTLESTLKPGQRLALPSMVKDNAAVAPSTTVATAPVRPTTPGAPPPKPTKTVAKAQDNTVASQPEAEPPSPNAVAAGRGKFAWPIKGDILSAYGPKGPGQRNDGLNIAAKDGETVRAAAAGAVVYAGNSVPGFGNLVVVKHPGGWTSLYGNLGKMTVKIGSQVTQGEQVGLAGTSGSVDRPQVHFEVRYAASPQEKARPVDPQTLLP